MSLLQNIVSFIGLFCKRDQSYYIWPPHTLFLQEFQEWWYGVATTSRLLILIITGLFCKRVLWKRRCSAKETYHFKEPTDRSHPITTIIIICGSESPILWKNVRKFVLRIASQKFQWTFAPIELMVLMLFARWIRCSHSPWGSLASTYVYLRPVEDPCEVAQYPSQAFCEVDSMLTHFARQIRENTPPAWRCNFSTFETHRTVWNMRTLIQHLILKTTGQTDNFCFCWRWYLKSHTENWIATHLCGKSSDRKSPQCLSNRPTMGFLFENGI